ncbi:hypothetical protein J4219_02395 [Candidatus Woesearchaeota archaeon]|nr:hypothetical protein [Candidatus Woesearchaeota archaeon]
MIIDKPDPVFIDFLVIVGDSILSQPKVRGDLTPRKYDEMIESIRAWTPEGMLYYRAFLDTPSIQQEFERYKANLS